MMAGVFVSMIGPAQARLQAESCPVWLVMVNRHATLDRLDHGLF